MLMLQIVPEILAWLWSHRRAIIAVVLLLAVLTPQPAQAQFGFEIGIIVSALNAINSAITNVIGGALRIMNETLSSINGIVAAVQNLFQNIVYPESAILRARGLVGQVMGIYGQIRSIAQVAVNSATLENPRNLEQALLSRDPMQIPNISGNFQTVYQTLPAATDASPELRNVIDMTDAAAQAALKRAIAIDAIADRELEAAQQMLNELQNAAPGTASMIGAQGAAWLVRSHAYTQAALADSIRLRAIELANAGAELKLNAGYGAQTRRDTGMIVRSR